MSTENIRYYLRRTRRKYLVLRFVESGIMGIGIGLVLYGIGKILGLDATISLVMAISASLTLFAFRCTRLNLFRLTEEKVMHYVNRQFPQLEESGDLLLREDDGLTALQQLQKLKTIRQFEGLYPAIRLPDSRKQVAIFFIMSVTLFLGITLLTTRGTDEAAIGIDVGPALEGSPSIIPASIKKASVIITPPVYTGKSEQKTNTLALQLPEGSRVQWNLLFTTAVTQSYLIFAGQDSLLLNRDNHGEFSASRSFNANGFYQIAWAGTDGVLKYSDYYPIEVVIDQPPVVKVNNLDQFIELDIHDSPRVTVLSTITDDYGLRDAYIIATVSKGSGEAVKFREEKLRFTRPDKISGASANASLQLDVHKLGLDPGDELYFYVEALDTKVPAPNRSRTETFFIALLDTAAISTSVDPGLGVDLLPEYFRSQRQIIIDSEKLLREKKKIAKESFNGRSNELGYDQKVLRLRYGEFLGEEFETNIGPHAGPSDQEEEETDLTKKYGHVHDKDNDHNLVEEKKPTEKPAHVHGLAGDNKDEDPSKAYIHAHDSEEEATFFTQSIRAKLKAAVTIMWDAELYLRLYQPEKSLPFQYKALKLLKEISQDSRIYVHRTGFDPPPLKEEKRLTGDLSEIKTTTGTHATSNAESYPEIQEGAQYIEQLLQEKKIVLTPEGKAILVKAGQGLSGIALKEPGRYLTSLSRLKAFTGNELNPGEVPESLREILSAFYQVLPTKVSSPQAKSTITHPLDDRFFKNLEVLNQR